MDDFDDKDKNKILNLIDIISANIPYDDIYNSICNKQNDTQLSDVQIDAIVQEGVVQFKTTKNIVRKSNKEVMDIITKYEPFNDEKISSRIWEIVKNEK